VASEINFAAFRSCQWGGNVGDVSIIRYGVDWSGATFSMKIATAAGAAASKTITNASAGSEGLSATHDNTAEHPVSGQVVGATTIVPQIDEASLETLVPSPTAADVEFYYTLYVTPSGEAQRVLSYGTFTIRPGVPD
jgi:hypothetical protein